MRYTKYHKTAEIARLPRAVIAGGASIIALVVVALALTTPQVSTRKALPEFSLSAPGLAPHASLAGDDKPVRLVYRNSVVPGGVHSAAELAAVIARDPVAAVHYANFDVSKAHLVLVEKSRTAHVSYRIGNQIYWTKNKVRLTEGEALLSDGTHLIRARCGNRLADEAEGPVLINEPAPEVLETAFVSAEDLIDQHVSMAAFDGAPPPAAFAGSAPAALAALADASPPRDFDVFGPAGIIRLPTSSGVTVLPAKPDGSVVSPHAAPALPLNSGADPAPGAPADPALPGIPGIPADPIKTPPTVSKPGDSNDPVDGKPGPSTPDSHDGPFIDPPIFTPPASTPITPAEGTNVPEPGSPMLAGLGLLLLIAVRLAGRRSR